MTAQLEAAHWQRLRDLDRRLDACAEAGNSEGCDHIQKLIESENVRWSLANISQASNNQTTK